MDKGIRIAIIGAGHLGNQILHYINQDTNDKVVAFFDEYQQIGNTINCIPIIGGNSAIIAAYNDNIFDQLIIAIGYKHMNFREKLYNELKGKVPFYTFIHSTSWVDKTAKVGEGSIIYPKCTIDQNVKIGDNVLLNIGCAIAHDTRIGAHSFLAPSNAIAGFVTIEERCVLGINSTVIDNIIIARETQLGAGTVVIKNIKFSGLYVGNPARFIR